MLSDSFTEIKSRVSHLSHREQLRLLEHLARELLRQDVTARKSLEEELALMAVDPDIRRELNAIEEEFAVAESDGLEEI